MSRIGFVLLTHSKPHQIERLVTRLNSMFDSPPIVIHHDFGKCPLPEDFLPANVSFVLPHLDTGWATFNVVKATVKAIAQMYASADPPDWCVVLSGSCYPIKPAAQILTNLTTGHYDAHINGRKIDRAALETDWHRHRYQRYCVKYWVVPSVDKRLRPRKRWIPLPYFLGRRLLPFHDELRCFGGSQWFSVSHRAAAAIAEFQTTPDAAALAKHYRDILFSEESYFQTILYSAPKLNLNFDNWVYVDWSEQKPHPKQLTLADLPKIQASTANFARKIDIDSDADLLDALDTIIDGGETAALSGAGASTANAAGPKESISS